MKCYVGKDEMLLKKDKMLLKRMRCCLYSEGFYLEHYYEPENFLLMKHNRRTPDK